MTKQHFECSTIELAKELLGCRLVHNAKAGMVAGRIVETEAYLSRNDPASHSAKGIGNRNRTMFGPPGCLYVYSIHNRFCLNIVSEPVCQGSAVLIRAIEPDCGIELMQVRRPTKPIRELTNGPGKLCQSLGIDKEFDGIDLITSDRVWLETRVPGVPISIRTTPRIGISQAQELPLRFFVDGNPFVSGRASDHSIPRYRANGNQDPQ